jgi:broad specificity phosphatase PhoE
LFRYHACESRRAAKKSSEQIIPGKDVPDQSPFHLLLLRHGQTDANATGVLQGHQPTPLNALGREQAKRLAHRVALHRPKIAALVSSDLKRAAQTAEPIAAACGLAPLFDVNWRERGFGRLEGKTVGERETWRAAHGDTHPPGGESVDAFRSRVKTALESVANIYSAGPPVAVVTHGGPIGVILRMLADGTLPAHPDDNPPDISGAPNCSILELVRELGPNGHTWRVACLNDVTHLEGLVTETDSG